MGPLGQQKEPEKSKEEAQPKESGTRPWAHAAKAAGLRWRPWRTTVGHWSVCREDRDATEEFQSVCARRRVMNGGGSALGAHYYVEEDGRWSMVVVIGA